MSLKKVTAKRLAFDERVDLVQNKLGPNDWGAIHTNLDLRKRIAKRYSLPLSEIEAIAKIRAKTNEGSKQINNNTHRVLLGLGERLPVNERKVYFDAVKIWLMAATNRKKPSPRQILDSVETITSKFVTLIPNEKQRLFWVLMVEKFGRI